MSELRTIKGAGGGGQSSHTPVEAPNTLRSRTTARLLMLISRGECGGLADQASKLKSVYFNNNPVMNQDGSLQFTQCAVDERYGLPVQPVMTGYPSATNTMTIGTKVTTSSPGVYTTNVANIDALRLTIRFAALFETASNGDTNATTVQFNIFRRLGSGAYSLFKTITKTDKCISPADADFLVPRPTGSGTWSVKVERITPDNSSTTKANDIYLQFVTEIQDAQLPYNGYAYAGVTVSAETTGSSFPTIAFDYYGIKLKVPSNYTVSTRTYSGEWDGTFSSARQVCDNPAWVLYYLLTDPDGGMGSVVSESDVDQYSFYEAARYCDELVPNAAGTGTEPRYTFNYQFMEQQDAWTVIQNVAASFGAVVYTAGNMVKLVQDRPTSASRLITNSNVVDGLFEYSSSSKSGRYTGCIVYWNDPAQNMVSTPAYYEDAGAVARYGLNVKEVTGLGITSEGQALRLAKWTVETSIANTYAVTFKVGFSNAGMLPGEVVKVMDADYAMTSNEAKVAETTGNSVTLDREVLVTPGDTIEIVGADGVTVYSRTVSNYAGPPSVEFGGPALALLGAADGTPTYRAASRVITFNGDPINVLPGADVIVTTIVEPRLFKITGIKEESAGTWIVSGVQYDPDKFSRVDNTPSAAQRVYQALPGMTTVSPVVGLGFREESYVNADGTPRRALVASWAPVSGQFITSYRVLWSKDDTLVSEQTLSQANSRLEVDSDGVYKVAVIAINAKGLRSSEATAAYALTLSAPTATSPLSPVTGLVVKGAGGATFSGTDCTVVWSDPNTNGGAVVAGYVVTVADASTPTNVYRTDNTAEAQYTYDLAKQKADNGANLKRSFIVTVQVKDTFGRLSNPTSATFTNPAPATVTGIAVYPSYKNIFITWNAVEDRDVEGYLIWRGTAANFTPSSSNLIGNGLMTSFTDASLSDSTTYFYKVAAYDVFGKSYAATGLNVGASAGSTTLGSVVSDEFKLTGVTWTPNAPGANQLSWTTGMVVKTLGSGAGNTWNISAGSATFTSGVLYVYYLEGATALSTTNVLMEAIGTGKTIVATYRGGTNLEYGDGRAYTDGSLILAGTVGTNQLQAGSVVSSTIAAGTITGSNVAAGTLDATKLNVTQLSAITATIGTLRTSSSGQRVEIKDNVIKVYDANNVLRVRIGDLSL